MELHRECAVGGTIYSLYRKFGVSKLFRMADQGHWDQIPERVRKYPKEAFFVHKYAPCDNALHRLLRPLHVPCPEMQQSRASSLHQYSTDIPTAEEVAESNEKQEQLQLMEDPAVGQMLLAAVEAIAKANPDAVAKANLFGRTPLHLALMDTTSFRAQAAAFLIQHTPMTTVLTDECGCTALHFLMDVHNAQQQAIVDSLLPRYLQADPEALERCNQKGLTPFDVYMKSASSEEERQQRKLTVLTAAKQAQLLLDGRPTRATAAA